MRSNFIFRTKIHSLWWAICSILIVGHIGDLTWKDKFEGEINETTTPKDLDLNFVFCFQRSWFRSLLSELKKIYIILLFGIISPGFLNCFILHFYNILEIIARKINCDCEFLEATLTLQIELQKRISRAWKLHSTNLLIFSFNTILKKYHYWNDC